MGYPIAEARINPSGNWSTGPYADEGEANAHLIAAAPEMKEALEEVLRWDAYPNSSCRDRIKAALAKANGETPKMENEK